MCVQSGYHKVVLLLHQAREWYEGVGINPGVGPRIQIKIQAEGALWSTLHYFRGKSSGVPPEFLARDVSKKNETTRHVKMNEHTSWW